MRLARTSLLAACALVLSYLETMIPLPVALPGVKLGLANVAVIAALYAIDARCALGVAAVKVAASGFLFGSPMMLAYSFGGMTCAFLGMLALYRIPGVGCVPVSMASAILHNAGQLAVAACFLGTPAVFLSLPPLALCACATGALTGAVAQVVVGDGAPMRHPFARRRPRCGTSAAPAVGERAQLAAGGGAGAAKTARLGCDARAPRMCRATFGVYRAGASLAHKLDARAKVVFAVLFIVAAFVAKDLAGFVLVAVVAAIAPAVSGIGAREAFGLLKPFRWLMAFVLVFNAVFTSSGAVLLVLGPLAVTEGGVAYAVESVTRFAFVLLGTGALMRTTTPTELADAAAWFACPFSLVGLNVEAVSLSVGMTFRFVPTLAGEMERIRAAQLARSAPFETGSIASRAVAHASVIAPLLSSALRRADALAYAIETRAFGSGVARTKLRARRMAVRDWAVVASSCVLVFAAAVL